MDELKDSMAPAHCEMGPSSLPPRDICPCHRAASGGSDAESGTRSHKVVELTINYCETDVGQRQMPDLPAELTDDEKNRGIWGAKQILELRDQTAPGAHISTETRLEFHNGIRCSEFARQNLRGKFGTADAFWLSADGSTAYIADYKTYANGDGEKSYLPQGMAYAVLLDSMIDGGVFKAVFFVVAAGDYKVARYEFTLEEARAATVKTISRVEACRQLFGETEKAREKCGCPSPWCKTCAHSATCPAISRSVASVQNGGILTKPLAVRMAALPILEAFVKSVRAEVAATLDRGERVFDPSSGIEYAYAQKKGQSKLLDLKGLAESVIITACGRKISRQP